MLIKTDDQHYKDIANAIRNENGKTNLMTPAEMITELKALLPLQNGCSYDTFDAEGNILTATTYGDTIFGLGGKNKMTNVTFDTKSKIVEKGAFLANNSSNLEIYLPNNVTTIKESAFEDCQVKKIVLPDSVTSIGDRAFYDSNINITALPPNLTFLGSNAFYYSNIGISELPEGVTSLKSSTFNSCDNIKTITLHDKIKTLFSFCFGWCDYLTTVTFLGTPTYLDSSAFYGCNKLTTINVPWSSGEVSGAPWGATKATINYNYGG